MGGLYRYDSAYILMDSPAIPDAMEEPKVLESSFALAAIHIVLGISILLRTAVISLFPLVTPLEYFLLDVFLSKFLAS